MHVSRLKHLPNTSKSMVKYVLVSDKVKIFFLDLNKVFLFIQPWLRLGNLKRPACLSIWLLLLNPFLQTKSSDRFPLSMVRDPPIFMLKFPSAPTNSPHTPNMGAIFCAHLAVYIWMWYVYKYVIDIFPHVPRLILPSSIS